MVTCNMRIVNKHQAWHAENHFSQEKAATDRRYPPKGVLLRWIYVIQLGAEPPKSKTTRKQRLLSWVHRTHGESHRHGVCELCHSIPHDSLPTVGRYFHKSWWAVSNRQQWASINARWTIFWSCMRAQEILAANRNDGSATTENPKHLLITKTQSSSISQKQRNVESQAKERLACSPARPIINERRHSHFIPSLLLMSFKSVMSILAVVSPSSQRIGLNEKRFF